MSEEDKGAMEKKTYSRQSSVPPKANSSDTKKENGTPKAQKAKRRGNNGFNGANFSYNEGPARKATPQKYKNTWDKRPRSRGGFSDRPRSDLEENALSEYGSAIHSGSKKGSLNHLLNFTYAPHESGPSYHGGGGSASWSRGRQVRYRNSYSSRSKVCYNKEQFLQANCQFVVRDGEDYSVHLMDPDILVKWETVEQVRVTSLEPPSCPICLQYPTAAKMTRCGHIYCWACVLHYLALGEKNWRKCPICYESIHSTDLKSVVVREVQHHKVGDTITMTLMKKEKGSIYAVPAHYWTKQERKCHNVDEPSEMTHHLKLLTAKPHQVLDIIENEKKQLDIQLKEAELSEEPFIIGAQAHLKEREEAVTGVKKLQEEIKDQWMAEQQEKKEETTLPAKKYTPSKKVKQYKSAFSDEEDEGVPSDVEDTPGGADSQTGDSRQQSSSAEEEKSDYDSSSTPRPSSPATEGTADTGQNIMKQDDKESSRSSPPIPVSGASSIIPDTEKFDVGSPEGTEPPIEVIPDIMPVEEAAEHLELPAQADGKARKKSGDECFYFYQAADGQHLYLHSLNARCLVREYGSLENSPQQITATIVEKESVFVTEELRKRLRYLSHLPLTCGFEVCELAIKPPVIGKDTLKYFHDEIEKRRRQRHRRNREDKRRARQIEDDERKRLGISKETTIIRSQFHQPQLSAQPPFITQPSESNRSDTSSPSLDTPVGSPLGHSISAPDFHAIKSSPTDEGQTAVVSFAQMLKAGAQSTKWPVAKTEQPSPPVRAGHHGSDDSDNEDRVPVPEYHSSFGSAIEAALENIGSKSEGETQKSTPGSSGKKKKKQLVLFSTSMARGGGK